MPLYDYACYGCAHEFEKMLPVSEHDTIQECPACGSSAGRIVVLGHGGIQCDSENDVPWLASTREVLQDSDTIAAGLEKPIETRGELKKFIKDHDIEPKA